MAKGSVLRKGTVWSFVVDLEPDTASGRRRQARRSGFATKKAAEAALRSLATASEARSHSTIAITLDLYSHVAQGLDADAAELIASRIYGREK